MTGVDEVGRPATGLLAGLEHGVVTQVGRDVDVGAAGTHGVELVIAGAAHDRHRPDPSMRVTADPDAARGRRQGTRYGVCELSQRHRRGELADAPSGIRPDRGQGTLGGEPECVSQHGGDPRVGDVGVGVGDVERDVRDDEMRDGGALGARRRHRVDAAKEQRMMRDEQVGVPVAGLLDDGERRVQREGDAAHRLVGVAGDEADPVPVGRAVGRIEPLQRGDDLAQRQVTHVGPAGLEPTTPAV